MGLDYFKHKKVLKVVGAFLLVIGILLCAYGFIHLGSNSYSPEDGKGFYDGSFEEMEKQYRSTANALIVLGTGSTLIIFGLFLLILTFIRPISKYYATEASPGIKIIGESLGEGLKDSGFGSVQGEVVKIRCPYCGYLESEDAEFCSNCGKKIR